MATHPTYQLTLGKSYYNKGFFNLGVAIDRNVRKDNGPIQILLGDAKVEIRATVNRDANINGTPRIMGGAELRNWIHRNFEMADVLTVAVLAPDRLWLYADEARSLTKAASARQATGRRSVSLQQAKILPTNSRSEVMHSESAIRVADHDFQWVCAIEPQRSEEGAIREFLPQKNYENANGLALNKYGAGPFCKFKIPANTSVAGVYVLTINGEIQYVGETVDLSSRYNMGYGNISPRNCFLGGQETNCRINNRLLEELKRNSRADLWFLRTEDYKKVEHHLRRSLRAPWNRA